MDCPGTIAGFTDWTDFLVSDLNFPHCICVVVHMNIIECNHSLQEWRHIYRNYLSLNNSNTRTWVKEASGKYKPLLCNRKKTFLSPLQVVSFQNTGVKAHICGSGRGCHFYQAGKKNLNILKEELIWPSLIYFTHVQHFIVYFSSKNPLTTRHVHDTWSYT